MVVNGHINPCYSRHEIALSNPYLDGVDRAYAHAGAGASSAISLSGVRDAVETLCWPWWVQAPLALLPAACHVQTDERQHQVQVPSSHHVQEVGITDALRIPAQTAKLTSTAMELASKTMNSEIRGWRFVSG